MNRISPPKSRPSAFGQLTWSQRLGVIETVLRATDAIEQTLTHELKPVGGPEDARDFLNAVREAKKSGRSVDEFVKSWTLPARYTGYAPTSNRLQGNVEGMYKELP